MNVKLIWHHRVNTNTIPIVGWALIEIIRDPSLFQEIRSEALTACDIRENGTRKINMDRLVDLPLLQSTYAEILRLHDSINVTREVTQDMVLEGYNLKKGYLIQAPSYFAHHDQMVWDDPEHPAHEFWAKRHLIRVKSKDKDGNEIITPEFSLMNRAKDFFPYGEYQIRCVPEAY